AGPIKGTASQDLALFAETGQGISFMSGGSGTDAMTILSGGNVGIGTTNPTHLIMLSGGAYSDGTNWTNGSDRNSKENFTTLDPQSILEKIVALPITQWNYKVEPNATMHIGPMAQDFYSAFGLGGASGNTSISTIDPSGVALLGIQALNTKTNQFITSSNNQISNITSNQNKIVEQLTGQLADQTLSVDNKLQLIGASLDALTTNQIATLKNQIAANTANISSVSADLKKLQDQYNTIQDQYSTLSEILLVADGVYDFKQAVLKSAGIVSGAFAVKVTADKPQTIGEAYICPESDATADCANSTLGNQADVETSAVTSSAKIFVTAENDTGGAVWVEKKSDNSGFKILIKPLAPITEKIKINWWIVEKVSQ
ncbi:MAG: tail fiber domain-containing protein, partial [Candidatus Moranbacteria bacterium]|nr:tail fiber domain-containing protein [Candidatus Moranbacteria bacterium]